MLCPLNIWFISITSHNYLMNSFRTFISAILFTRSCFINCSLGQILGGKIMSTIETLFFFILGFIRKFTYQNPVKFKTGSHWIKSHLVKFYKDLIIMNTIIMPHFASNLIESFSELSAPSNDSGSRLGYIGGQHLGYLLRS